MQEYEGYNRKLAAIFSADVVGYSRLMGDDEAKTVKTLTAYREIIYQYVKQHRGRVVDSPGDNLLAEFASVVDAAQCAVTVQKEIKARNLELDENRRMQFRIGINLGDVIEEDERIYGDGVNIAARLESLAEPGGICISKTAFDHIESKLPFGYEFIGEQTVKNISRPVFAYRVIMDPNVVSGVRIKKSHKKTVLKKYFFIVFGAAVIISLILSFTGFFSKCSAPPPEKSHDQRPSIVILPLKNMSGDPDQDAFSDGITEELIHSLARVEGLRVVSQTTSFSYKGKSLPISTIANDLSVSHVLEGSVRKDGSQIRITVQLVNVADDSHLMSETYDREMKDIFNIQDEISKTIVEKLKIKLLDNEYVTQEKVSIVEHKRHIGIDVRIDDDEFLREGLFAIGLNVEMAGSVKGGLEAYGGDVVISGFSHDEVNFWGFNVELPGYFQDTVKGGGGNLIISGIFEKDLVVDAKNITVTPDAVIKGDFVYSGVLHMEDGSGITGEIINKKIADPKIFSIPDESEKSTVAIYKLKSIYGLLSFLLIGFFINYFFPKLSEDVLTAISSTSIIKSLVKGLLFLVLTPLIVLFSFISVIGIPFAFLCISFFSILSIVSIVCGAIWIGRKPISYLNTSLSRNFFISFTVGFIIIESLSYIPYAGWIVKPFFFTLFIGGIWQIVWSTVKNERKWKVDNKIENNAEPQKA
jgi:TolB-like protein/class 3 adenylate cyclase